MIFSDCRGGLLNHEKRSLSGPFFMGTDGLFPFVDQQRCVVGDTCGGSCSPLHGVNREVSRERNGLRSICEVLAQFLRGQRDVARVSRSSRTQCQACNFWRRIGQSRFLSAERLPYVPGCGSRCGVSRVQTESMLGIYLSYRRFDGPGVGLHLRKQTLYSRGRPIVGRYE